MDKTFSGEITLLKALAIMLVVSGHLEFSILGIRRWMRTRAKRKTASQLRSVQEFCDAKL